MVTKNKIFLTGAFGFLGSHIAVKLVKNGFDVVGLVRRTHRPKILRDTDIEYCIGDLLDPSTYESAIKQCNIIIHTAANTSFWLRESEQYYRVNHEGTKTLLECAKINGVERFIYASTRGALGVCTPVEKSDENCLMNNYNKRDDYTKSKYLAHKEVLKYSKTTGINCIILAPTALIGAFDEKPSPIGNIIFSFLNEKIRFYMNGGINIIDVEDAAQGFISAIKKGKNGKVYILGNQNVTLYQIFKTLSKISGRSIPLMRIPYVVAYFASVIFLIFSRITGRPPLTTPKKVVSLHYNYSYCNPIKAQKFFKLSFNNLERVLGKTVNWYNGNY